MNHNQTNEPPSSSTALRTDAAPFFPSARRTAATPTAASAVATPSAAASTSTPTVVTPSSSAPTASKPEAAASAQPTRERGGRGGRGSERKGREPKPKPSSDANTTGSAAAQSSTSPSGNQTNNNGRRGGNQRKGAAESAGGGRGEGRNRHADPSAASSGDATAPSARGRRTQPSRREAARLRNQNASTQPTSKSSRASGGACPYDDDTPIPDINPASVLGSSRFSELSKSMSEQLICGQYDCASCLDVIKHQPPVWSCKKCYRIFHLYCIKQWAKTEESGAGKSFRCPFCQHPDQKAEASFCFCGKVRDPKYDPGAIPHSCGDLCCAKRGETCPHPCPAPCHPGPCPPCSVQIKKPCACGKSTYSYGCDRPDPHTTCENVCGKTLNCGKHACTRTCHTGPCSPCERTAMVACACGKDSKETLCGAPAYQCDKPCDKKQRCGVHSCTVVCHAGNCPPCDSDPAMVDTCPCGKVPLASPRTKCTDPIPLCGNICDKALMCGHHSCDRECHLGPCGKCDKRVMSQCLCRQVQQKMNCADRDAFRCEKVCKTKMSCGKHECMISCCSGRGNAALPAHICNRVCGKQLPCGHPCPDICHPGMCAPCTNVITHELRCRCGTEVLIPPLPCGTVPPPCNKTCRIDRPCGHSDTHKCHYGDCPPCAHLVDMMCFGGHLEIKNIKCGSAGASCGRSCKKALPCGHECPRRCHLGDCLVDQHASASSSSNPERCTLPCGKEISECGHFCEKKCHSHVEGSVCRCSTKVTIECSCGLRKKTVSCAEHTHLLAKAVEELRRKKKEEKAQRVANTTTTADTEAAVAEEKEEDIDVAHAEIIECDNECYYQNRLTILAERGKFYTGPRRVVFSLLLHEAAQNSFDTITLLEKKIQSFLDSKEETLLLPAMKADRRAIVHELAQYYNLKTHSVDSEPNRSVNLTKGLDSSAPTPLLSAAIFSSRTDENPEKLIYKTLTYARETRLRVLAFAGTDLDPRKVTSLLTKQHGRFVAVNSVEAEDIVGEDLLEGVMDLVDPSVVFAIFLTAKDLENAFNNLRALGKCGCVYQRINIADDGESNGAEGASGFDNGAAAQSQLQKATKPTGGSVSWSDFATSTKSKKNTSAKPSGPSGGTLGFEALRNKRK